MNQQTIDTKSLSILHDQMEYEAVAAKKAASYMNQFQDQALCNLAGTLAAHHKNHFEALYTYLNSHN